MSAAAPKRERTTCPDCGAPLRLKRDGLFRWKACTKCDWDVFKQVAR